MTWVQYEVWADVDGHDELIDTTHLRKEAINLAKKTVNEGAEQAWVYEETSDGDYTEIERISK